MERAVHTAVGLSVICGLFFGILGIVFCRPILILLGDEGRILTMATTYSRIYFCGAPFVMLTTFVAAIFRAKGDTKTPMKLLMMSGLVNVLLNLFFVLVCKMDVDGVSLATVLSNVVSSAVLLWLLHREDDDCRFDFKKLKLHKSSFQEILRIGLPAGIQGALANISKMTIQSSIITVNNTECPGGSAVIDGSSAAGNLETFVYTAANSVYQGSVTFVSQHYGTGKISRIKKVMGNCYLLSAIAALGFAAVILIFQKPLVGLYVSDPKAVEVAYLRDSILLIPYFLCGFFEVGCGVLRGMGRSTESTLITFVTICVFRVAWNLVMFPIYPNLFCVYISYPISWVFATLGTFLHSVVILKKELKKEAAKQTV